MTIRNTHIYHLFKILSITFFFIIYNSNKTFAIEVEAFPKGDLYDNPRVVILRSDSPKSKIMWTKNPDGTLDESFVYELPIPIHYSQELWFFAFDDENNVTPFHKEKYTIRVNPNRYSKSIFITEFSPHKNFIILTNNSKKSVNLKYWKLISRNDEYQFSKKLMITPKQKLKINLSIGDFLDRIELKSPDYFLKDFFRYKIEYEEKDSIKRKRNDFKIHLTNIN